MTRTCDAVVVGGGLLGSAIAYGLAREGVSTTLVDEGDVAYRAARGNFGLVWVQSKGIGFPAYADWTMQSADLWHDFATELFERTGIDVILEQPGGIHLCLSAEELAEQKQKMETLSNHQNGRFQYEMLDHKALSERLPGLGPEVVGGSYTPHDGHVNPLYLMRALQRAFLDLGGILLTGSHVHRIHKQGTDVLIEAGNEKITTSRLVLAAGLGNKDLAPMVDLVQPIRPVKGQIMVSERVAPFLGLPTTHVRQTGEGSVMIGDSKEDVGFDIRSDPRVITNIAERARRYFPFLGRVRIVRSWAALRVMSPDGLPVYDQSETIPGAFTAACHSGVTLAAVHALKYAKFVLDGKLGSELQSFKAERFHVQTH